MSKSQKNNETLEERLKLQKSKLQSAVAWTLATLIILTGGAYAVNRANNKYNEMYGYNTTVTIEIEPGENPCQVIEEYYGNKVDWRIIYEEFLKLNPKLKNSNNVQPGDYIFPLTKPYKPEGYYGISP